METFTPYSALLGGLLIGLASAGILFLHGRVCGISGMLSDLITWHPNLSWSGYFLSGMILGGLSLHYVHPIALDLEFKLPYVAIFFAGFLVSFGARLGGGCTSGHGVCGVGRLDKNSIIAMLIFTLTGMLTATILYHFFLGDPQP